MKQSTASKTLLAIVTILTVMMALIVPSPAYAAKEPPPPPPPPSNDTGGQGKPSHSSVKDLPADTTVVVTDNGTPVSLALQLTVDALSAPVSEGVTTNYVKFCKADNTDFNAGDCSSYTSIENAITFVKGLSGDASGVFYVDVNYPAPSPLPKPVIALDQSQFVGYSPTAPFLVTDLSLLGGVKFSGSFAGQQGLKATTLVQPFTISNFLGDSSVSMDLFEFDISDYKNTGTLLHPVYDADSALAVVNSNNVTLTDLTIDETSVGNGIKVSNNSNNVAMDTINVTETKKGAGILIKDSTDVSLKNVKVDESSGTFLDSPAGGIVVSNTNGLSLETVNVMSDGKSLLGVAANGDALNIQNSSDISMDDVVTTAYRYGAYLKNNTGTLSIDPSNFSNSGYAGLYVTGQDGKIVLDDVTADNNGKSVPDATLTPFKFLYPDLASGAAFMNNKGALIIKDSEFNGNATAGLWVQDQMGGASVEEASATGGGSDGFVLVKDVDANGNGVSPYTHSVPIIGTLLDYLGWSGGSFIDSDSGKVVVKDSNFNENNGDGLEVYATGGDLILKDVAAKENLGTGAKLNTFLDLNGLELGTGSILIFGDEVDFDAASDGVYSPKYTTLFDMNEETGLNATSGGEILLNGVEANDNGHTLIVVVPATPYDGADLLALGSPSDTTADATVEDPLSGIIVANAQFNGNTGDGLSAQTIFGEDIGVFDTEAKLNGGNGATLGTLLGGSIVVGHSDFIKNGGTGLKATALLGGDITTFRSHFIVNGADGMTATTGLGDIGVFKSDFIYNGSNGLTATAILGDVDLFGSDFIKNKVDGAAVTTLVGDIRMGGDDFIKNVNNGATATALLGDIGVFGSDFIVNDDGLSATALVGNIILFNNDFKYNGGNGATATALLGGIDVIGSDFIGNEDNGLSALSLGDILLLGDEFKRNGEDGASVASLMGVGVLGSDFFCNDENGLSAIAAGPIIVGGSDFIANEGNGASLASLLGIAVVGSDFVFNGENGLTAMARGDIFLAGVFAGANEDNGAVLTSLLGDVTVFSGVFGNPPPDEAAIAGAPSLGNGENGLVATSLFGDITLGGSEADVADTLYGEVDANNNGMNGIVAATLLGDITAQNVYADENNWFGAITIAGGDLNIADSQFDANGTVFPTVTLASVEDFSIGGGLVAFAGGDTTLDTVDASYNHGFGAVVGNFGGLLDLLFSMGSSATGNLSAATGLPDDSFFGSHGDVNIYDSTFKHNDAFGLAVVSGGDVTLDHVQANDNGWFGTYISFGDEANISDSHFSGNGGDGLVVDFNPGPEFFSTDLDENTGSITLDGVIANHNGGDGAVLIGTNITISDSKFDSNAHDGLVTFADTLSIYNSEACWNKHQQFVGNGVTINHFGLDTECKKEEVPGGAGPTEQIPLPWQIIKVYTEPGKNGGTLSCQFGTTFLYLEKKTPPTPDFEWARAVLFPCIVPGGSIGTFLGLAEGALPAPLPDGITFQGKAFDLSITGPNGQPIDILGGPMMVRFTLPDGFTLPAGKKLDILWFDPAAKKWVELTTYAGGRYAWGYAGNDGTFVLTIK